MVTLRRNVHASRRKINCVFVGVGFTRFILLVVCIILWLQALLWVLFHNAHEYTIEHSSSNNSGLALSNNQLSSSSSSMRNTNGVALPNNQLSSSPSSSLPTIQPLRTQADKDHAQQCLQLHHRGSVYYKHHRKTGGSVITYQIMRKEVCPHAGIQIFDSEYPYFNSSATFGETSLLPPTSTVFITTLRHPIDRIISLYWFEGRWPRTCGEDCENKKVKDNTTKVADLEEWVNAVYHQTNLRKFQLKRHTACGQWQSVENYYMRQLLGVDRGGGHSFLNKTLTRQDLHRAKEILASFDLVLIQEEYNSNPNLIKMLRSIVGSKSSKSFLDHRREGLEKKQHYEPPSMDVLQRLEELNKFDIELYEYARYLSNQTVTSWAEKKKQPTRVKVKSNDCKIIPKDFVPQQRDINIIGGEGCPNEPRYLFSPQKCVHVSNDAKDEGMGMQERVMAKIEKYRQMMKNG